ncbi:MAG TPA: helix-turn-helix domain-containing protein [Draconibacterium sp.]|nr:helix-turn-helix domain-containing protein [Draconibacterium sp.]
MWNDLIIYTPMYVTFFWALVLLISKRNNNRARFFLGIFMFVAFLLYLSHAHFFKKLNSTFHIFEPIYIFASLSVYPLYYWYIKLLSVESGYKWKNLRLLIPAAFFALTSIFLYMLMNTEERLLYINELLLNRKISNSDPLLVEIQKINVMVSRVVFFMQVLYFLIKGQKLVKQYNRQIANFYSNLESKTILWVNFFLYSFVVTSVISIVFNIIGRGFFMESPILLLIPSLIFSVLLFFIGFLGYMQNHTVIDLESEEIEAEEFDNKSYNKSLLNDRLLELFADQSIYKNPDLKITHLSELLSTNRTYISKHINTEFSCTFSDFVNRYRIEEAKKLLSEDSSKTYSLNYISEKSGFGSMGSFMRVFRDSQGITPGQYRDRQILRKKNN